MITQKIGKFAVSLAAVAGLMGTLAVLPAYASTSTTTLSDIITAGDTAIDKRLGDLNAADVRVNAMVKVSTSVKATLHTNIQTNLTNLAALRVKLDADTSTSTARADKQTITGSYRIYALVLPQTFIIAAADRVNTAADANFMPLAAALQVRITAAQTAGHDVTVLNAQLADLYARVATATSSAQAAITGVSGLVPDQHDDVVGAANHQALVTARAKIADSHTGAQADLLKARNDARNIVLGLKAIH